MNELGNTTADKDYKPSGIISEEYPEKVKVAYLQGYEQAEKDIKKALLEWLNGYNHPVTRLLIKEVIDKINSL